jgi:phage terminase large subunit-like protein
MLTVSQIHTTRLSPHSNLVESRSVEVRLPDGTLMLIPAIEVPHHVDEHFQSWDCTFKERDTSDYVVGQLWARRGALFLLGDKFRERTDCPGTVKTVRAMTEKWLATMAVPIEDKANGSAVIQMLSHEIPGLQ